MINNKAIRLSEDTKSYSYLIKENITDEEFFEELDSMEALDSYQGNINIKTYWKRVLSEVMDPAKRKHDK